MSIPLTDRSFSDILDNLSEGVYYVTPDRRVTYWNRAAEEITGYAESEVLGRSCPENFLMHVDERGQNLCQESCPLAAAIADGDVKKQKIFLRHKNGYRVPIQVRVIPLKDEDGQSLGAVEIFQHWSSPEVMHKRLAMLERLAMLDELTNLPNRRYLEMRLASKVNELERFGLTFGVLMVDIDHFKAVNDNYGHERGDQVLRMVARTLRYSSRAVDSVGRWGGEEFVAIVAKVDAKGLLEIAERLRNMVKSSTHIEDGQELGVTISVGAAVAEPGQSVEQLLKQADEQLYQAKHAGRDRVCVAG